MRAAGYGARSVSRILVTGGAGFIGSHIVDALVADGHAVRVVDSLDEAAHDGTPDYLNPGAEYVWRDVRELPLNPDPLDGVDAVCHQAAKVGLGVDFGDAAEYVAQNDQGTANLLWALHNRRFTGRVVLASSMVVYGEGHYRCVEHGLVRPGPRSRADLDNGRFDPPCPTCGRPLDAEAVPEDALPDPRNVYAATKLHQEHLCSGYARESGAPVTILRYHNVYGARMPRDTPYAGVASIFRSALADGRAPRVFEDGAQRRDFVHVRDVARANVLALTRAAPARGVFNIASGRPRTVGELAAALASAMDGPAPIVTGEYRLGDVRHVFAATAYARDGLGFEAREDFAAGMREFAQAPLRRMRTMWTG
jgi:dTDP-L-rhamnose 4-epimerase